MGSDHDCSRWTASWKLFRARSWRLGIPVQQVLADPPKAWLLHEVAGKALAEIQEIRRNLRFGGTSFREILLHLRLSTSRAVRPLDILRAESALPQPLRAYDRQGIALRSASETGLLDPVADPNTLLWFAHSYG